MTQTRAMTILLNIKSFHAMEINNYMYNHDMKKQPPRKPSSMIFLILGITFLAIGLSTDNAVFTWIAIAFVVISLVAGGRWLQPRK
jgi:hypothetical protein